MGGTGPRIRARKRGYAFYSPVYPFTLYRYRNGLDASGAAFAGAAEEDELIIMVFHDISLSFKA